MIEIRGLAHENTIKSGENGQAATLRFKERQYRDLHAGCTLFNDEEIAHENYR